MRRRRLPGLGCPILILLVAGCAPAQRTEPGTPAHDPAGCDEAPAPGPVPAVMVNRSWLARYPTLQEAVAGCFRPTDTGAVMLTVRVSRSGAVCEKVVQRDSTGRPASVSCFLAHFVRWEMKVGSYRLLVDLTSGDRV